MKNLSTFAVNTPSSNTYTRIVIAFFIAISCLLSAKDKGLSTHNGLSRLRSNLNLAVRGEVALLVFNNYLNFSFMPSSMKDASEVNNSSHTRTFTHETGTFLTADNIERLKNLFSTPENYAKNLGALWVFRDLLYMTIEKDPNPRENQLFALWQTVNEVVSSLIRQDVHFDDNGRAYYYDNNQKIFI